MSKQPTARETEPTRNRRVASVGTAARVVARGGCVGVDASGDDRCDDSEDGAASDSNAARTDTQSEATVTPDDDVVDSGCSDDDGFNL